MENKKPKILHFESDPAIQDIFKYRFTRDGFDYEAFGEYENHLDIIAKEKPDLLIMSIVMPDIDGYEAIKMLKADERTKDIPFVIFTNLGQKEEVKKGLEMGALKYLLMTKYTPNDFVEEIKKILKTIKTNKFMKEKIKPEKRRNKSIKKDIIYISSIAILFIVLAVIFSTKDVLKNEPFKESAELENPGFLFGNDLSCEIKLSSSKEEVGRVLSLLDLQTDSPKMLSDLGGTSPMIKMFESQDTLVIGLVASGSGSTDIFVLNKTTGVFARTESGNLAEIFAFASKGTCK